MSAGPTVFVTLSLRCPKQVKPKVGFLKSNYISTYLLSSEVRKKTFLHFEALAFLQKL